MNDATLCAAATHEVARAWAWCALYSLTFHRRAPASVRTQICGLAVAAPAQPACTSGTASHWLQSSVCSLHKWLPLEPCTPESLFTMGCRDCVCGAASAVCNADGAGGGRHQQWCV